MKSKFRPFTVLLLIILLVVGINVGLYHMGYYDDFLAGKEKEAIAQNGEGPVVRRAVSNLVLPLESSESGTSEISEELNEADISTGNKTDSRQASPVVQDESEIRENKEERHVVAEKPIPAPKVSPAKPQQSKNGAAKLQLKKSAAAKGVLRDVSVACDKSKASVQVGLSVAAGKVSWFNLNKPRRLVVDLHGKWKNKAKSLYHIKDCPVQKIVLGEHADKVRLVVYLDGKDVPVRLKPVISKQDKGVSVSLNF